MTFFILTQLSRGCVSFLYFGAIWWLTLPVMVPWTWVPFFNSMVTVSWLSFIKNLWSRVGGSITHQSFDLQTNFNHFEAKQRPQRHLMRKQTMESRCWRRIQSCTFLMNFGLVCCYKLTDLRWRRKQEFRFAVDTTNMQRLQPSVYTRHVRKILVEVD